MLTSEVRPTNKMVETRTNVTQLCFIGKRTAETGLRAMRKLLIKEEGGRSLAPWLIFILLARLMNPRENLINNYFVRN